MALPKPHKTSKFRSIGLKLKNLPFSREIEPENLQNSDNTFDKGKER